MDRWQNKMTLTEHTEAYDKQKESKVAQHITPDEMRMLRDFIILPYLQVMVQKSIEDIDQTTNVLKRLYTLAGQRILNQITKDLYVLKRKLKQHNIRIIEQEQTDFIMHNHYVCRGYTGDLGITRDKIKSEISLRLSRYIYALAASFKDIDHV